MQQYLIGVDVRFTKPRQPYELAVGCRTDTRTVGHRADRYLHSTLILKFSVWFFRAFRTLLYRPGLAAAIAECNVLLAAALLSLLLLPASLFMILRWSLPREIWIRGVPSVLLWLLLGFEDDGIVRPKISVSGASDACSGCLKLLCVVVFWVSTNW